jgi:hypothetical protein
LANLGQAEVLIDPSIVLHHVGTPGRSGGVPGVDDPLSTAEFDATKFRVAAYRVGNVLDSLGTFDPSTFSGLLDGLDAFLNALQALLDQQVLAQRLPLLGPKLKDAVHVVSDLRSFVSAARSAPNQSLATIKQKLFDTLGPPGVNLLRLTDRNGDATISAADIVVEQTRNGVPVSNVGDADRVEFQLSLHQDLLRSVLPIDFDLGFDSLGLTMAPG